MTQKFRKKPRREQGRTSLAHRCTTQYYRGVDGRWAWIKIGKKFLLINIDDISSPKILTGKAAHEKMKQIKLTFQTSQVDPNKLEFYPDKSLFIPTHISSRRHTYGIGTYWCRIGNHMFAVDDKGRLLRKSSRQYIESAWKEIKYEAIEQSMPALQLSKIYTVFFQKHRPQKENVYN